MLLSCHCVHAYQDSLYGPGRRVHNPSGKKKDMARCTVCGVLHPTREPKAETKGDSK